MHLNQRFSSMKTFFEQSGYEAILALSPPEKEFAYYMSMVTICSYPITLFQNCPYPSALQKIWDYINTHPDCNPDIKTYWLYLFSNYGCHCERETELNKKVPSDLNLNLTSESFKEMGIIFSPEEELYLFNKSFEPTSSVSESIEKSGSHFYDKGVTTELYHNFDPEKKDMLNGYYTLENDIIIPHTYSATSICSEYICNMIYWLMRAHVVASNNPEYFDLHTVSSLKHLIDYYRSGDENDFKLHSEEWLQMRNSKVEYTTGFIETYDDPMGKIGTHQSDVTIKSLDISELLKLLPIFEAKFKFPREWKRLDMTIIPNASTAHKIIGMGGLGPILSTIAYCLPNYEEMRSKLGSKQVMYTLPQSSNLELYKKIYLEDNEIEFFNIHSPDMELSNLIDSLCTTLHETIGHASGANTTGIDSKTKDNLIGCWGDGLEEMRAEIIALYVSTHFLKEITESGILGDWYTKVPEAELFKLMIQEIAGAGISRWRSTPIGSMEIKQAHALADTGILYYLLDHSDGAMELKESNIKINDVDLPVIRLVIHDVYKVLPVIEQMAYDVQELSSNANFDAIDKFMKMYAVSTRNIDYSSIVKQMQDTCSGGIIERIQIFPEWTEVNNEIKVSVPTDPILSTLRIWELAHSHFY